MCSALENFQLVILNSTPKKPYLTLHIYNYKIPDS